MKTFKIGEVAQQASVNKETVRYYEKRELITKPDRRRSGYRIFTQQHVNEIRFIKRAQQLGFTLSEIKEMMALRVDDDISCGEVRVKAEEKYQDVMEKIEDLKRIKNLLIDLIESCEANAQTDDCIILNALEGKNETGKELR